LLDFRVTDISRDAVNLATTVINMLRSNMINAAQILQIVCKEKGRGETFEAEVDADCTADEIVRGLVEARYLAPPTDAPYIVINGRTGATIPPGTSLAAAGVQDGEVLTITSKSHGACAWLG
jgi:hypothetical protein